MSRDAEVTYGQFRLWHYYVSYAHATGFSGSPYATTDPVKTNADILRMAAELKRFHGHQEEICIINFIELEQQ